MDYEFEMEKPFILTTADMLEIAASGGNGSEYVDIVGLMENAAKELREKDAEIERLREALHEWDALIEYTYNGSREAMSAMTDAAHNTAQILYGDPPWPDPKSHAALKGNE